MVLIFWNWVCRFLTRWRMARLFNVRLKGRWQIMRFLARRIETVRLFRQTNDKTPIVLMGYLNPVHKMGYQAFAQAAAEAGVDGVLTVDSR